MKSQWIFPICFVALSLMVSDALHPSEKIVLGQVEDVILLPWKIKLPARIDTGAAFSSLDARDLRIETGFAKFKLPQRLGGKEFHLPVVDWLDIRSSEFSERRPIVEVELCIGPKRIRTKVNLNDRSRVRYPLLIGRNTLKGSFIVDCMRERCSPPSCPEASSP